MIVLKLYCVLVLFIATCDCAMEGFIEGGEFAKIESFPHSVYLYIVCEEYQSCGGSILTQQLILTAAHCFEHCLKKYDITAYAGSENTERMIVAVQVTKFRIHKHYKSKLLTNDIALGLLESALTLSMTMKRVIIGRNSEGVKMARMAGWGVTNDETLQQTEKLKMVTQIIQPLSSCQQIAKLKDGMICAKNSHKSHPTHGDSGSALVSANGQQIGLVSWRHPNRKDVVIYTSICYYYDWILTEARKLICSKKK